MRALLQIVSLWPAVPKGRERRKQNGVPSENPFVSCFLRKEDKVFSYNLELLISKWGAIAEDRNRAIEDRNITDFLFSSVR